MRTMSRYLSILALALVANCSAWADGVQDKQSAREECSAYSAAGMRDCLEKKAGASGVALRKAENIVRKALDKWDEDMQYVNIAKSKFEASSKEFLHYRDTYCAFNASLGGGAIGNALEIRRLACVVELNVSRTQQIENAVSDLPLK